MVESMVSSFFNALSTKMWKENDLSDITWSMCQASPYFFNYFIHFFFPELDIKTIVEFERERPDEQNCGSRVDFLIKVQNDEVPYLIEVKINDRNQHFGQYDEAYGVTPDRLGYITNYPLAQEGYDRIRQWSELYNNLDADITSLPVSSEKSLMEGYLTYVKNVCGIIKLTKPMNIKGLYSMFELFSVLNNLTTREEKDFSLTKYGLSGTETGCNFQIWFHLNYKHPFWESKKEGGLIGLWYNVEQPIISMGFQNRSEWGESIYQIINDKVIRPHIMLESEYYGQPYTSDDMIYIDMKPEVVDEFDKCEDVHLQERILYNFMDEVLRLPIKLLAT